jgi:hypothetical protein
MNLSLFSFYEICRIGEHEPRRFEYMTMKVWFKGFKQNLFHIFVSYILFVTDVKSPCINKYKQGIAGHADLRGIVWGRQRGSGSCAGILLAADQQRIGQQRRTTNTTTQN